MTTMLISATELQDILVKHSDEVVIFDCRFRLDKPQAGLEQYLEGHIPGAWYLDLEQDLSSAVREHGGRHPLPDEHELAEKLGRIGVGEQTSVIVYDAGEGMAPRAWWLIRYLGHNRVRILDGGLGAWESAGYNLTTNLPAPRPQKFPLQPHYDWVVYATDVEDVTIRRRQAVLLDARTADRYRGEVEPLDPKAGHIPGAVNAPWQDGLTADGFWRQKAEQQQRFAKLPAGREMIAYCGSGVTACVNLFAMELAGIKGAKLYAGSWSDWCSYEHLPIGIGDE